MTLTWTRTTSPLCSIVTVGHALLRTERVNVNASAVCTGADCDCVPGFRVIDVYTAVSLKMSKEIDPDANVC